MSAPVRERTPAAATTAPAPRPAPRREVVDGLLVAVATGGAVLALRPLLDEGGWLATTWAALFVLAVVIAAARRTRLPGWAPTVAGAAVAAVLALLRYGAETGTVRLLPDLASLGRTHAVLADGFSQIQLGVMPLPVTRPVEGVVVLGAVLVLLSADALVAARATAWAGLPLFTLWLPGLSLGVPGSGWALAGAGVPYLLLLTRHSGAPRPLPRSAAAWSCALVVLALLLAPAVLALPSGGWALPRWGSGQGASIELSDDLDLRQSLSGQSGRVVLRYRVSTPGTPDLDAVTNPVGAADVGPLRVFTLETFDGRRWGRSLSSMIVDPPPGTLLSPDAEQLGAAPDASLGALAQVDVEIDSLAQDRLPVTTSPRTLDADGPWRFDLSRDEVVGASTTQGFRYSMVAQLSEPTADQLAAAGTDGLADEGVYLSVPESVSATVRDTAAAVTADATTPYARALALQDYFRSSDNFTYDTKVAPATSGDAVADFLSSRRGYCVQFASAMAVMARIEGIPSRVAVGFLPGTATSDGTIEVTGRRAHAWPELYFAGFGWVRFEPTPAVQTGAPPGWTDPSSAVAPTTAPDDLRPEDATDAIDPSSAPTAAPGSGTGGDLEGSGWSTRARVLAAGGGLLALAGVALMGLLARREAARAWAPEEAWDRLRRRVGRRGVTWSDADTPRTAVDRVRRQVQERAGAELDDESSAALRDVALRVERARYAPHPDLGATASPGSPATSETEPSLRAMVDVAASGVTRALSGRAR